MAKKRKIKPLNQDILNLVGSLSTSIKKFAKKSVLKARVVFSDSYKRF